MQMCWYTNMQVYIRASQHANRQYARYYVLDTTSSSQTLHITYCILHTAYNMLRSTYSVLHNASWTLSLSLYIYIYILCINTVCRYIYSISMCI